MKNEMKKNYLRTPLWNNSLPPEERLDYLLQEMTLDEKFQCLGTGCIAIERLGIKPFSVGGEGAHGVQARHDQSFDRGEPVPTTIFTNPIGMSASWDTDLIREVGCVVGKEARGVFSRERTGGLCLWAPTVDMERDPRWGRTEEGYGEDPYLAGKMAAAYIRGLRGEDSFYLRCGATLKHFYANNTETGRTYLSSSVSPRNKQEYYLEPYRRAVLEGGAEAIMTAYNEVNGIPCIVNPEIQRIAKNEWGVKHVVCDGGDMMQTVNCHRYFGSHSETIAAGLKAGIDCFTDEHDVVTAGAREAYERGMISTEDIDRALRNHFGTMLRLGLFDAEGDNPYRDITMDDVNTEGNQAVARQMAKESVILLKNENRKLPILRNDEAIENDSGTKKRLAVIGPWANAWYKDWYSGIPPYHVTVWEALKSRLPESSMVLEEAVPQLRLRLADGRYLGLLSDRRTLGCVEKDKAEEFEALLWDRHQITLRCVSNGRLLSLEDGENEDKTPQEGIVTASKDEAFGWFVREAFHIYPAAPAEEGTVLFQEGNTVILRGWNDSRLCIDAGQRVHVQTEDTEEEREDLVLQIELVRDGIEAAVAAASSAEEVVVVLGPNPVINSKEEKDRSDIKMPPYQEQLLHRVCQVHHDTVLVMVSSIPFDISWEKQHVPAILLTASGSMELGNAVVDCLLGDYSPAGRLNMTWYRDVSQLPDINDYDIIQHGRTYQYFEGDVLYPFGHGLTYASFSYENMQVRVQDFTQLYVTLDIVNTGAAVSDEVVQIYVRKEVSAVKRAKRQLKAFRREKEVLPGERRHLHFTIPIDDLKYYDVIAERRLLEDGEYTVEAAASSADIRLAERISLKGQHRGIRDGSRPVPADHFDSSENALLLEGDKGYTAVSVQQEDRPLELVYERVKTGNADYIVLDGDFAAGTRIEVYADEVKCAGYMKQREGRETEFIEAEGWAAGVCDSQGLHGRGFGLLRIPLEKPGDAETDSVSEASRSAEKRHNSDGVAERARESGDGLVTLRFHIKGKGSLSNWYLERRSSMTS